MDIQSVVLDVVSQANKLKNKYTDQKEALVNYACIFSHSKEEYDELLKLATNIGNVIKETPTGPLFHIQDLQTDSGTLKLLKIRLPDTTRPERGDADFTVGDYENFKTKYLPEKGFKLIKREAMEMIELIDKNYNVRAYFSNPPLDKQLGLAI